jgi:hypothetical protein
MPDGKRKRVASPKAAATDKPKKSKEIKKNAAAQALSALRWKGTTASERSEFASRISRIGWTGEAAKKRVKAGGRPRATDRCPCGAMTAERAKARGHRCVAK